MRRGRSYGMFTGISLSVFLEQSTMREGVLYMEILTKIKNKIICEKDKIRCRRNWNCVQNSKAWQNVADIDETMDMLLTTECSMCRFGDGEFKVMTGGKNGFQQKNEVLARRLRQVLKSCDTPNLLVCVPNVIEEMPLRTEKARRFWVRFMEEYGGQWTRLMKPNGKYYNTQVTRLYMDYLKPDLSQQWYRKIDGLWRDRDILIVEGEKTRMGMSNELLSSAKSIRRILCPSKSAFSFYDQILETVKQNWNGELVLIALGQTATVLAYDLHLAGIRALDVGHLDVEYEWFRMGATEKVAIAGKFVKEVDEQQGGSTEQEYEKQIVARVGVSSC